MTEDESVREITADASSEGSDSGVSSSPEALTRHRSFGRYTLLYRFAAGGMASLHVARLAGSDGFEKLFAIKLIHEHLSANPGFVKMFIDEARLCSRISHPNVVQVVELGKVDQTHYLAMEYIDGESLAALLRRERPSYAIAARIAADTAAGLHAAHELRGADGQLLEVVHRDVSPHNVLISYEGVVKLVDFGVARALSNTHQTQAGAVKGKVAYMAPEHARGADIDRRADVYSLGVTLYETSTRRRLFKGKNDAASLHKVLEGNVPDPRTKLPDYPEKLLKIIMRALDRDPAARFQTAREMQEALEAFLLEVEPVRPGQIGEMMKRIFADRIAEKKVELAAAERAVEASKDGLVPKVDFHTGAEGSGYESSVVDQLPRRFGPLHLLVGGLAMLVLAMAIYVGFAASSRPPKQPVAISPPPPATRPVPQDAAVRVARRPDAAPPRKISLYVSAQPRNATIRFAGRMVSNPFKLKQVAEQREVDLVLSARGHEPRQLRVSLATSQRLEFVLRRVRRGKKPPGREGKHGKGDKFLDNPYGP